MSLQREIQMETEDTSSDPLYFGVSCAFLAFHLASKSNRPILNQCSQFHNHTTELMLQSRIHLLGLLLAKTQSRESELEEKLRQMELQVAELRIRRTEDAKANEKVAGIFAAHEQRWIAEKRSLQRQLQLLINEMSALKSRHEDAISDLKRQLEEEERAIGFKDQALEEEMKKCEEAEKKLKQAEQVMGELRESATKEEQDHATEIRKHKTAFVELVSNQRRLDAELARTVRQADMAKRELEQAVMTVDELSADVARLRKDTEQKDKVITAMLRKSKIDTADKQMLLKEVKMAKARKKQAELEGDRWRKMWQSQRHGSRKGSSRGDSKYYGEVGGCSDNSSSITELEMEGKKKHLGDYFEAETRKERERELEIGIEESSLTCVQFGYENDKPASEEFHQLQDWVRMEAEKFASILEKQHNAEIEAFTEQMRLKDERVESLKWRLLTTELEKKRIQSKLDALNQNLHLYRDETIKLETILSNKNQELDSLKEKFSLIHTGNSNTSEFTKEIESESEKNSEIATHNHDETSPTNVSLLSGTCTDNNSCVNETYLDVPEIEEEKEVSMDPGTGFSNNNCTGNPITRKELPFKNDIHALGVSYKIKRLKQQLAVLEKLKPLTKDDRDFDDGEIKCKEPKRSYVSAMALLNKQVKRYQSLEEKIDHLCTRMDEIKRNGRRSEGKKGKKKEETERLEDFLEETFQLQRYMVATGQKLTEIQSKIKSSFSGRDGLDKSMGLNMAQFGQIVKCLFREIQRGLEVRIARMIGDLEGTLASDGILHK